MVTHPVTVLIVPGLRDQVAIHWQTLLEARLRAQGQAVASVPPLGRADLDCATRVAAIEEAVQAITGPMVLVAHSGGCLMVAHWARQTRLADRIQAALLATPPDFEQPMPEGYPTQQALQTGGWFPLPRGSLPFRSLVAASRNDPLGAYEMVAELAQGWGSELMDLGEVGHLNPASGFGDWPLADSLIQQLSQAPLAA
jgi:hypothetical protein